MKIKHSIDWYGRLTIHFNNIFMLSVCALHIVKHILLRYVKSTVARTIHMNKYRQLACTASIHANKFIAPLNDTKYIEQIYLCMMCCWCAYALCVCVYILHCIYGQYPSPIPWKRKKKHQPTSKTSACKIGKRVLWYIHHRTHTHSENMCKDLFWMSSYRFNGFAHRRHRCCRYHCYFDVFHFSSLSLAHSLSQIKSKTAFVCLCSTFNVFESKESEYERYACLCVWVLFLPYLIASINRL